MREHHDSKVNEDSDTPGSEAEGKFLGERSVRVSVAELRLHPDNPRRGNVGAIKESLNANGLYVPLTVSQRTMEVLRGNHTLLAARELGWTKIDVYLVRRRRRPRAAHPACR